MAPAEESADARRSTERSLAPGSRCTRAVATAVPEKINSNVEAGGGLVHCGDWKALRDVYSAQGKHGPRRSNDAEGHAADPVPWNQP